MAVEHRFRTPVPARAHDRVARLLGSATEVGYPGPIVRASGALLWDADGNEYVDLHLGSGALVAGHAHPSIVEAVRRCATEGVPPGAAGELAAGVAEEVVRRYPFVERVRFAESGSDAIAGALRAARAATGRTTVVKAGGLALGPDVAAVVVEPVGTGRGLTPPADGYLAEVRELTRRHGVVLVFDERRTGCRIAPGGAVQRYGVAPDIVVLGSAAGGGLPFAAYGGPLAVMAADGTDPGPPHPLPAAAALACLTEVLTDDAYAEMERVASLIAEGVRRIARMYALPVSVAQVGPIGDLMLADEPGADAGVARWSAYWHGMLDRGVVPMAGAWHESWGVSVAHTEEHVDWVLDAAEATLADIFGV